VINTIVYEVLTNPCSLTINLKEKTLSKFLTIQDIIKENLCTGCGTCASLCPQGLIKMHKNNEKGVYIPVLELEECNNCNLCLDVCPGHSVDFNKLNKFIFGKNPDNMLLGNYENCYTGHAVDSNIRYNSSSGGLITSLLIFALEEGLIDGAVVTKMSEENPLEPKVFIAKTREDIIEASKSKYCPVPANIAIRSILDSEGKFAFVGLPCHIHGIRKAEMLNKKLREKIVLHIGIFCGHTPNFLGTEYLLYRLGINKEQVKKIDYRGEGWPGSMTISLKNGDKEIVNKSAYWGDLFGKKFFTPLRCTLCTDGVCEFADISFGDAWLPEFLYDKKGVSIIVSRNKIGNDILQLAKSRKKIQLERVNGDKIIQSQEWVLNFKKRDLNVRFFLFNLFGRAVPFYGLKIIKPKFKAYLNTILLYFRIFISSKSCFRWLLSRWIPIKKKSS